MSISTDQTLSDMNGHGTHHGDVKDFERLRLDGPKQAMEEDGVKKGAEDLTSVLAVENLCKPQKCK